MSRTKSAVVCLSLLLELIIVSTPLVTMAQQYVPPQRGLPGRREGAGTRGTCMQGQKALMPLTPMDGFSATASDRPTFFWFVPSTNARTAEFFLLDKNDKELYRTAIALPGRSGIVSFTLPADAASLLTPGNDYYWQFSIICDPNQPSRNPFVEGVVQRVKPDPKLVTQLQQVASARDRAILYANAGIWHDAITVLAQQRCNHPQDSALLNSWTRLLQSVRLEGYTAEPQTTFCSNPIRG